MTPIKTKSELCFWKPKPKSLTSPFQFLCLLLPPKMQYFLNAAVFCFFILNPKPSCDLWHNDWNKTFEQITGFVRTEKLAMGVLGWYKKMICTVSAPCDGKVRGCVKILKFRTCAHKQGFAPSKQENKDGSPFGWQIKPYWLSKNSLSYFFYQRVDQTKALIGCLTNDKWLTAKRD